MMKLSLGPVQYYWHRETIFEFYQAMAETPVAAHPGRLPPALEITKQ